MKLIHRHLAMMAKTEGQLDMTYPHQRLYFHRHNSGALPRISRSYDTDFEVDSKYREQLPDIQDAIESIEGANVPIQQVGIHDFRLPLTFQSRDGVRRELETTVSGTVSLRADMKGINMSRIMRSFYDFEGRVFDFDTLEEILNRYRKDLDSMSAFLKLEFSYPIIQKSLRSGLEGYQYYPCSLESVLQKDGSFRRFLVFDYTYSSACPCSAELSEHARDSRGAYAVPHSQRSRARLKLELAQDAEFFVEDIQAAALEALKTETQVMVKREDEQAFAELNGAYLKFVEDAARLLFEVLDRDERIVDFVVACSHQESLHSHDAVSVISKGISGGLSPDFRDFGNLRI